MCYSAGISVKDVFVSHYNYIIIIIIIRSRMSAVSGRIAGAVVVRPKASELA